MKFKLTQAKRLFTDEEKEKYSELGFKFRPITIKNFSVEEKWMLAEDFVEIEINSLEELIKFAEKWGNLIIEEGDWGSGKYDTIIIYNDYWE